MPLCRRAGFVLIALAFGWALPSAHAQQARWVAQLLRKLPRTDEEVVAAFNASKNASIQVAVGEPLEVADFSLDTTYDVTVAGQKQKRPFKFERLGALTFGMAITPADEADLPAASKGTILERVNGNYISIQLRPQKDVETGAIYLYYKPFAAIGSYNKQGTQEFSPLMEDSVRDFRGIGLFVKQGTPITAEALRTFVAINKTLIADVKDPDAPQPNIVVNYEFTFARAYVDGDKVSLHTFATNEFRQQLHYLQTSEAPRSFSECGVQSTLYFTKYTAAKQSPSEKALRRTSFNARSSYWLADLDKYAASAGLDGGAWDNLTDVLDAIIAGKVPPNSGTTATAAGK